MSGVRRRGGGEGRSAQKAPSSRLVDRLGRRVTGWRRGLRHQRNPGQWMKKVPTSGATHYDFASSHITAGDLLSVRTCPFDVGRWGHFGLLGVTARPISQMHKRSLWWQSLRSIASSSPEVAELIPSKIVPGWCLTTVCEDALRAYDAPFPSQEYAVGARRFPEDVGEMRAASSVRVIGQLYACRDSGPCVEIVGRRSSYLVAIDERARRRPITTGARYGHMDEHQEWP